MNFQAIFIGSRMLVLCAVSLFASPIFAANAPDDFCANCETTRIDMAEKPAQSIDDKTQLRSDIKALKPLANYVGTWRGIGQKRRGSAEGAWMETAECAYDFFEGRASLVFDVPDGKLFVHGRIEPTETAETYRYIGLLPDGKTEETYLGKYQGEDSLLLNATEIREGRPARIGIKIIARGDRMLTLFERKDAASGRYLRISEIGATRKGSGFGGTGAEQNACVVTGGHSKGKISYKGEGYYICCGGCREMFNEDPEAVLAEWKLRLEEERKESLK